MNASDIKKQVDEIDSALYKLSDKLAGEVKWDGIDPVYLAGKIQQMFNTAKHCLDQAK